MHKKNEYLLTSNLPFRAEKRAVPNIAFLLPQQRGQHQHPHRWNVMEPYWGLHQNTGMFVVPSIPLLRCFLCRIDIPEMYCPWMTQENIYVYKVPHGDTSLICSNRRRCKGLCNFRMPRNLSWFRWYCRELLVLILESKIVSMRLYTLLI